MKTQFLIFLTILSLIGCSKSDNAKVDPVFQLPPETQTGANTFGVTIKGKVYIPRDPTGYTYGGNSPKGLHWTGLQSGGFNYKELIAKDGASLVGFKMTIHIENLNAIGTYILKQSNFQDNVDSAPFNHIYFKIFDYNISNYAYYGSIEDLGIINITKLDLVNDITSGNFSGKFVRYDNPNEFIQITDGRFDTGPGLLTKVFP